MWHYVWYLTLSLTLTKAHGSQYVWYRKLYLLTSRYVWVNTLRVIGSRG